MMLLTTAFLLLSAFSCGGGNKANTTNEQSEKIVVNVPQFPSDDCLDYTIHFFSMSNTIFIHFKVIFLSTILIILYNDILFSSN